MTRSTRHHPDPHHADPDLETAAERSPIDRRPAEPSGNGSTGPAPDLAPSPDNASDVAAELVRAELASRRRRWPFLIAGIAIGAGAAYGLLTYLESSDQADDTELVETVELATAPVVSRDLIEEVEWAGTLRFGDPVTAAGGSGVITSAAPAGTTIERGDVVATVDEEPVVAFYGERPLWRNLGDGMEGPDVLLVEANLVALGYDPDVTVSVDEEFTANTALMVERWQADIGAEVTGTVDVADIALVPGPAVVTEPAIVGSTAQGALATVSAQRTVTDVVSAVDGSVADLAPIGSPVEPSTVLYTVDEVPVVAITDEQVAEDPILAVMAGSTFTTTELEQALADAGHDPGSEMTVDGAVTDATVAAIERWQDGAGLPVTGRWEPGFYHLLPAGQAVEAHLGPGGEDPVTAPYRPVLSTSASELRIEVVVGVADADEFEPGQSVTGELADETTITGTVVEVGLVERETAQSDPTVTVVIEVDAAGDRDLVEGDVTVTTVSETIEGATAVPTRALVSLAEGGFAVEVTGEGGDTRLVAVELGAFDDGYVEVTAGDVAPGDEVVVPR